MDGRLGHREIFIPDQNRINCPEATASSPITNEPASNMINLKEVVFLQQQLAAFGDQAAYVRLYRIYFTSLLQFARSYVNSKEGAEEIVSDVFLQLWQNRSQADGIKNLTVYLFTSIRNRSINYLQKEKRARTIELDDETSSHKQDTSDPEQLYITSELARIIDNIIRELPTKCRMIFKMIREDNLKYREVAEIMDISQKTVEAQMGIAMRRIHEAVRPYTGTRITPRNIKPLRLN